MLFYLEKGQWFTVQKQNFLPLKKKVFSSNSKHNIFLTFQKKVFSSNSKHNIIPQTWKNY